MKHQFTGGNIQPASWEEKGTKEKEGGTVNNSRSKRRWRYFLAPIGYYYELLNKLEDFYKCFPIRFT